MLAQGRRRTVSVCENRPWQILRAGKPSWKQLWRLLCLALLCHGSGADRGRHGAPDALSVRDCRVSGSASRPSTLDRAAGLGGGQFFCWVGDLTPPSPGSRGLSSSRINRGRQSHDERIGKGRVMADYGRENAMVGAGNEQGSPWRPPPSTACCTARRSSTSVAKAIDFRRHQAGGPPMTEIITQEDQPNQQPSPLTHTFGASQLSMRQNGSI